MRNSGALKRLVLIVGFLCLAGLPILVQVIDQPFYLTLVTRMLIFSIAAVSLDLILGYGALVSFGHAAFMGVGAYAVGIMAFHGINSGWVQWPAGIAAAALLSLLIGMVSLRTSGVYFIMITLAFAQMLYFLMISLKTYGGDDGLTIAQRSQFNGVIDLSKGIQLYYLVLVILVLFLAIGRRLVRSRFGMVLRGSKSNERRMRALGFPTTRYRLVAFVIAGAMCGVAGLLLGNLTNFASPAFMHWTRSGEIMVMVIMGGIGTLYGPVIGAFALLALEEVLSGLTQHWQVILGPILLLIVLFARRGMFGVIAPSPNDGGGAPHG